VLRCAALPWSRLETLVQRFGLRLLGVRDNASIPGSFWQPPEAGLVGDAVIIRADTPIHSLLHELAHSVCMSADRRACLDTDAGGDDDEESAVCYLEILLADRLEGVGRDRLMADMDAWGYSFRLGSAHAWFERDAADARAWLERAGLIDARGGVTWRLRT